MPAATRRVLAGDPPESTQFRVGEDEFTWSDVSGVYDRDDSLKENTNPKCLLRNHGAAAHHHNSQRFSAGNLKPPTAAAPIIGLPGALGARRHHHHHPAIMFPGKARAGGGRQAEPEPGSPRVSCFGKVASERARALRGRPRSPAPPARCCAGFGFSVVTRRGRSRNRAVECVHQSPPEVVTACRRREMKQVEAPVPGLGAMRRFSSGKRAAETEDDGGHVARSGPL
jgi:hypothetical protein